MLDSQTASTLREAMGAAQRGDLQRARELAEGALDQGGDPIAINAFLGMVRARGGDPVGAVEHLRLAHSGRPTDMTIACNLIASLLEAKDLEGALEIARPEFAFGADQSLRIARYRGFIAQSLERFDLAVEAYEYVVRRMPDDFESWNNLGNARSVTGDLEGSVDALERAMALVPEAPPTRLNLAIALRSVGRAEEAEALLRKTVEDFPGDARALHELYVQFKLEQRHEEAFSALERALQREPESASLQLKYGIECGMVGRIDDAERAFRAGIDIDPTLTDAYLGLAVQFEHTNRDHEFAPLIERAEANAIPEGPLAFLRALEYRRARRFEEALACLAQVPAEVEPERTAQFRGNILDQLQRPDEAFTAFMQANASHISSPSQPLRRAAELREQLRRELDFITPEWVESWQSIEPIDGRPDPVFLVGFPRSGTTLLDTILMGHPDTVVMEEQPPLNHVDKAIGGLGAIPGLDLQGIAECRAHYYEEVAKVAKPDPAKLLIDKSPLFLAKAMLIHRLFPNARFILALRHPCDALLSCFMSNFRLNNAMSNFLRLEDAAEYYDLVFQHWERARALVPLRVHMIKYERLIEGVEEEVRPLIDFLGLDWREQALDHQSTARSRGLITTASYSQVTEPIYKRAAGRWERYRDHLEPILPTLAPWVEKFGYSL